MKILNNFPSNLFKDSLFFSWDVIPGFVRKVHQSSPASTIQVFSPDFFYITSDSSGDFLNKFFEKKKLQFILEHLKQILQKFHQIFFQVLENTPYFNTNVCPGSHPYITFINLLTVYFWFKKYSRNNKIFFYMISLKITLRVIFRIQLISYLQSYTYSKTF